MAAVAPPLPTVDERDGSSNDDRNPSWSSIGSDIKSRLGFSLPPKSTFRDEYAYLTGLRGILTLQTALYFFFSLFLPAAVQTPNPNAQSSGPVYAVVLRKTLFVIFWNPSIIYSSFVYLSARTICIPFLRTQSKLEVASSAFSRGVRLFFPTGIALCIAWLALQGIGYGLVNVYFVDTRNTNIDPPERFKDAGVFFNALFNVFWVNKSYFHQAANYAWPTRTLWSISLLYQQSYTVYMTMVIVPYTITSWRVKCVPLFLVTAWWVQSWAFYSIAGLAVADICINMDFANRGQRVRISWRGIRHTLPTWPVYVLMIAVGFLLQYIYVAWQTELLNKELIAHIAADNGDGLNFDPDLDEPQTRVDVWLIVVGFSLLLETTPLLQTVLKVRLLTYLGERSLSYFLVTPILLYTTGILMFRSLRIDQSLSLEASLGIIFPIMVPFVATATEIFYYGIDRPSRVVARWLWVWITR